MVPRARNGERWCMDSAALLIVAGLALAALALIGLVRVVPEGHRGVVFRAGRVVRVRPPGVAWLIPALERLQSVALNPPAIDPLSVTAQTRDGVDVRLTVSVLWQTSDPVLAVHCEPDPRGATEDGVERALRHLVAEVGVANLLRGREGVVAGIAVSALPFVCPFGVELVDVNLLDAEVRVGPELLRLLA
jgi:regulator of protease activity HflC (stomatin/prohibitin superfamily)